MCCGEMEMGKRWQVGCMRFAGRPPWNLGAKFTRRMRKVEEIERRIDQKQRRT